jgi:predicted RNA binding protein YcfA (HicA-like mRNA interferase family)
MKLPRDLSGAELIAHLSKRWGYEKVHQVGSHVILQTEEPSHHRVAIPVHKPLRVGTLNAIISSVATHKNLPKEFILRDI